MGRRPRLPSVHEPPPAEPCPQPGCLYPDSGAHDCPATQQGFDDWIEQSFLYPRDTVGRFAKAVAANPGLPPFLRFKQALENAGLSGAAFRNTGERAMLESAFRDLQLATAALADLATEKGERL